MVAITVAKDVEALMATISITGLTVGQRYDVFRIQKRLTTLNPDTGAPTYERELPDRPELWSSVAHRLGWTPAAASVVFRDYETPLRPTSWFVCPISVANPIEHDWTTGNYPVANGVLGTQVVHFQRDLELLAQEPVGKGTVILRSTVDLASYVNLVVVSMEELKYTARGTEMQVLGRMFPVYVGDVREGRRGTMIFQTKDLATYNKVRGILFPADGRITPVIVNSAAGTPALLLDDMQIIPLDVSIEQPTSRNADLRFIRVDFVEIGGAPLPHRTGDNDDLTVAPTAGFTISDNTITRNTKATLTSTSTGQFDNYEWTISPKPDNWTMGVSYVQGPHEVKWSVKGTKTVTLRVYGSQGAHSKAQTITVRQ